MQILQAILKKFGSYIVIGIMLIAQCVIGWQMYKLNEKIDGQTIALSNVKDQITLDTNWIV